METKIFTKDSLKSFINSENFNELINIPISKQRAISQINNPRAEDDDVLLVAQFDGNKTVGYLGILPDYFYYNNTKEKIGWLTCFWVDEEYKKQGVAANLFRRVIRGWKQKIFITNIVPWLEPIYQKTKIFQPTKYKNGLRCYLRLNLSEILPPKKTVFAKLKGLLKILDYAFNFFADSRFPLFSWKKLNELKYEYHLDFNELPEELIESSTTENFIQRGKEELNWIIKHPWLIQGTTEDDQSSRYYFSLLSKRFINQIISFYDKKEVVGILFITIRDNNLTVPYLFSDKKNTDIIAKFLIKKMVDLKLNMITTFNEMLSDALKKQRKYFIYSKTIKKPYFISKQVEDFDNLNFQDGDGDCVFY